VMQAIDVMRHSRITQQLVPSTTLLSFFCCSQFACTKWLLMTFSMTLVLNNKGHTFKEGADMFSIHYLPVF